MFSEHINKTIEYKLEDILFLYKNKHNIFLFLKEIMLYLEQF